MKTHRLLSSNFILPTKNQPQASRAAAEGQGQAARQPRSPQIRSALGWLSLLPIVNTTEGHSHHSKRSTRHRHHRTISSTTPLLVLSLILTVLAIMLSLPSQSSSSGALNRPGRILLSPPIAQLVPLLKLIF